MRVNYELTQVSSTHLRGSTRVNPPLTYPIYPSHTHPPGKAVAAVTMTSPPTNVSAIAPLASSRRRKRGFLPPSQKRLPPGFLLSLSILRTSPFTRDKDSFCEAFHHRRAKLFPFELSSFLSAAEVVPCLCSCRFLCGVLGLLHVLLVSAGGPHGYVWTSDMDRTFLDLLRNELLDGDFIPNHAWDMIKETFVRKYGCHVTLTHLRSRLYFDKNIYVISKDLQDNVGFMWDDEKSTFVGNDIMWDAYNESNSEFKKYVDKPFPYKRQLDILCGKTTVWGSHFMGSTQEVDVEARRSFGDDDSVGREQFNAMGLESSQFYSIDGDNFNPFDFPSSSQPNPPSRPVGERTSTNIHPVEDECAGHQQWVGVQVCDVFCVLAAMVLPLTCFWRPSMWTFTVELGVEHYGRLVGAVWLAAQRLSLT
ncbi:hypothetical protein Taro_038657 [Colocasia esculenta]|uniref:Myb/SANT-like domain-containing protein n=1 Tax=Colocasia esculenta TaxID=4460 RepID=A0A843WJW8_COLES|nr:hypothetical protein [Colocasia esculenta]